MILGFGKIQRVTIDQAINEIEENHLNSVGEEMFNVLTDELLKEYCVSDVVDLPKQGLKTNKKWLGEILLEYDLNEILKQMNLLIIAPVGSGKTYTINTELFSIVKTIGYYLCDNRNVLEQQLQELGMLDVYGYGVLNGKTYPKNELIKKLKKLKNDDEVTVTVGKIICTTYASFSNRVNNEDIKIKDIELIICDEFHNLVKYGKYTKANKKDNEKFKECDIRLGRLLFQLCKKYPNTKIVYFTATPQEIFKAEKDYYNSSMEEFKQLNYNSNIYNQIYGTDYPTKLLKDIKKIDLRDDPNIMQYEEKETKSFRNYSSSLKAIGDDGKTVVATCFISTMKKMEKDIKRMYPNKKVVCIWSTNSDKIMNQYQLAVRKCILQNHYLPTDVDVLIINLAMETGVNIYDENINTVIVNTTDETSRIQFRGRVRKDIKSLYILDPTDTDTDTNAIEVPNGYLNRPLDKEELEQLIQNNYWYDTSGKKNRLLSVNKLLKQLEGDGYVVNKKYGKHKGDATLYTITK